MALLYNSANPIFQGQNIRPPLGTFFNGEAYRLKLCPELGRNDRSVLVINMRLQFQFNDGDNGLTWNGAEKDAFAHKFVDSVIAVWSEKFRITTTSNIPMLNLRDVGVIFEFPYYIDGFHTDDDFELGVKKIPTNTFNTSNCDYNMGNSELDSEDATPVNKGGSMMQRGVVHEFGHMLGLRDEYPAANDNMSHASDKDSVMHGGETVRQRHYAPFAAWITNQFATAAHLSRSQIIYKVEGQTDMSNALL